MRERYKTGELLSSDIVYEDGVFFCTAVDDKAAERIAAALNAQLPVRAVEYGSREHADKLIAEISELRETLEKAKDAYAQGVTAGRSEALNAQAGVVDEDMALVPRDPPYPKKWVASGVRSVNGEETKMYLRYSEADGGWYQWDTSKVGAKLFETEADALREAKGCYGPSFNMPSRASISAFLTECPKAKKYREFIKAHALASVKGPLPEPPKETP